MWLCDYRSVYRDTRENGRPQEPVVHALNRGTANRYWRIPMLNLFKLYFPSSLRYLKSNNILHLDADGFAGLTNLEVL